MTTNEDRLRQGGWPSTIALSGDVITENTIHSINAVLWLVGQRPRAPSAARAAAGRTRGTTTARYTLATSISKTACCGRTAASP